MNELETQILRIIRRAIQPSFQGDILFDSNWDLIFNFGKEHKIIPILCEGILKTSLDDKIKKPFLDEYMRQALAHFGQCDRLSAITEEFDKNSVDYMILKGSRLKALYPKPEMRVMGDFDILIKLEQYEKIEECLTSLGLFKTEESDHEIIWKDNRFAYVELHKHIFPSYNVDFCKYFGTGWDRATKRSDSGGEFLMSKEDEYIFVFTHFAKHYRDGGIGIRHMLDIYLFNLKNPDMDVCYIEKELEKLGLFDFHKNIKHTLSVWFEDESSSEISNLITDKIFGSGAYGCEASKIKANALRVSNRYKTKTSARTGTLFRLMFPSITVMRSSYPVLDKLPMLLPFLWGFRLFKGVFFKRQTLKKEALKLKSINSESIEGYQTELERVGLGSKF